MAAIKAHARRYAQAAFEIALEKNELDKWQSDLNKIASLTGEVAFVQLLENPKIRFGDKAKVLKERLNGIGPLALNLAYLLMNKGILSIAGEIAEQYQAFLNEHRGILPATVTTAVPLDDDTRKKLAEQLSAAIGKQVVLKAEVDPKVIGGVVARLGGKLIDGSIRARLELLKKEMSGFGA